MRRRAKMCIFSDGAEWKRKTRRVEAVTSVAGDDDGDFFLYTNKDDVDTLRQRNVESIFMLI
jgi:hypothetical protein